MHKRNTIHYLLGERNKKPQKERGCAFAPSNIALCKYWGKRNLALNLPITSSLSVSLNSKGATATVELIDEPHHELIVNTNRLESGSDAERKLSSFLDEFLFQDSHRFRLTLDINIPIAAGLASSACVFASVVKALNDLYRWQLDNPSLSILARLGSGSACRSIDTGFVEWQRGFRPDGLDSYAIPITHRWPDLLLGIYMISTQKKAVSSREGMQRTVTTSDLYSAWPEKVEKDLAALKTAIAAQDFDLFGKIAENNALAMHATMLSAWPPLSYTTPDTLALIERIWRCREEGLPVYFTQDAGPNIKFLFLSDSEKEINRLFPEIEIIRPFQDVSPSSLQGSRDPGSREGFGRPWNLGPGFHAGMTGGEEKVILVDPSGREIGTEEKLTAHRLGKLHRAFSIFIFYKDAQGIYLLLQQRHPNKYHSGGLWTNTCCSHPRPSEEIIAAGERRLFEEMGIHAKLSLAGEFQYRAHVGNNLIENEYDHVLVGTVTSQEIHFDKNEITAVRWVSIDDLETELQKNPEQFTPWFTQAWMIAGKAVLPK